MLRKILRKSQPDFQHYVKKIEAQAKKWFSYKKKVQQNFPIYVSKILKRVPKCKKQNLKVRKVGKTNIKTMQFKGKQEKDINPFATELIFRFHCF